MRAYSGVRLGGFQGFFPFFLGQGMSVALGVHRRKTFDIRIQKYSYITFMVMAKFAGRQNWEAIMYAAGKKVRTILFLLLTTMDSKIDGATNDVLQWVI